MKKALALVLALVLALSMAVSAFGLVILTPAPADPTIVPVVAISDLPTQYLYSDEAGVYYIALDDKPYENIKLSANGLVSAELVTVDYAKMDITGLTGLAFHVVDKEGNYAQAGDYYTVTAEYPSYVQYANALKLAEQRNAEARATLYGVKVTPNVNIIKVTVAENYGVAHEIGTLKIDATVYDAATKTNVPYTASLKVISDVTIWEYEEVKWAAENSAKEALKCGGMGYSEFVFAGDYDTNDKYVIEELRKNEDAAVVSTTAFRAIAGKNLVVECGEKISVTLKAVAAGQKGVNFKYEDVHTVDKDLDGDVDAVAFEFYGKQNINGEFVINVATGYNWFTLREVFEEAVEEDDIISYYVLKNGKVVKEIVVDYMTADIYEPVVLELTGSNSTLGAYEIVMEVPAVEGETNPNTGAESVVGVVAALAVVSVATAAAVSLKK